MSGYSGTPLARKLGFRPGQKVLVIGEVPGDYESWVAPLPDGVTLARRGRPPHAAVHLFVTRRAELARHLAVMRQTLQPAGIVWISWPKKSAKVATNITEDVIREEALPLGLVDIKVCSVNETWSGLKLVIRRSER